MTATSARTATAGDIVLLAHGSPDRRHRGGVERLAENVRRRLPAHGVHTAYLDHHEPCPEDVGRRVSAAVVVPVLLTPAYHARVDVPTAVATMRSAGGGEVVATPALGPHPLLLDAAGELLGHAGVRAERSTGVILVAAGSSDSGAVASVSRTLEETGPPRGWGRWTVAALEGGRTVEERLAEVSVDRVVAVSFVVAGGVLRDRMAQRCARLGVEMVPGAFDGTAALADLVLRRVEETVGPPG